MTRSSPNCTPPGRLTALVRRLILLWLVVICFDAGCSARCAGDSAERLTLIRLVKAHRFDKSREQVFEAARQTLGAAGFKLDRPAKIEDKVYTSAWREIGSSKQARSLRIHKRLTGGVQIEIYTVSTSEAGPVKGAARLWPQEMEVIRRLEPERSRAIYQRARASGEEAEEKARGCAASCGLPEC